MENDKVKNLENWSLYRFPITADKRLYFLYGKVIEVKNGNPIVVYVKTGGIVSCDKNIVTTDSGIKYALGSVDLDWAYETEFELGDPNWISNKYWVK